MPYTNDKAEMRRQYRESLIPKGYVRIRWWHYLLAASPFIAVPLALWVASLWLSHP